MNNNKPQTSREKECYFCVNNIREIDYKDVRTLEQFINSYKKIMPSKRTGTCSWHQRKLSAAIKRARIMALLPFVKQ